MEHWPILVAAFLATFCVIYWLASLTSRYDRRLANRLETLTEEKALLAQIERKKSAKFNGLMRDVVVPRVTNHLLPDSQKDRVHYEQRLSQAGIQAASALQLFFTAKLFLMVTPPAVGLAAGYFGIVSPLFGVAWGTAAGCLGMILPGVWLDRRVRLRQATLRRSLPDFLDLTMICLESGLSLQGSLQQVTDELQFVHPTLAGELNLVQRDLELGRPVDVALKQCADRTGEEGIRGLATFVREATRFGTELSEALWLHADMLRDQREQEAEERAQKAAVKILIPTLLLIFPAVFIILAGPAAIQVQEAFSK